LKDHEDDSRIKQQELRERLGRGNIQRIM
jgi:hypothetical protein